MPSSVTVTRRVIMARHCVTSRPVRKPVTLSSGSYRGVRRPGGPRWTGVSSCGRWSTLTGLPGRGTTTAIPGLVAPSG